MVTRHTRHQPVIGETRMDAEKMTGMTGMTGCFERTARARAHLRAIRNDGLPVIPVNPSYPSFRHFVGEGRI